MNDREKHLTVADFMTTEPCTIDEELTLADARDRMQANNIRHLLVSKAGRMVGLVSSRDVTFATSMLAERSADILVRDAMTQKVYACRRDDDLSEVAWQMELHRYGCAVVVEEDTVIGIFTTTDALRALRQVLTGTLAEPADPATHKLTVGSERDIVVHHTRVSRALASHHAGPGSATGMIG